MKILIPPPLPPVDSVALQTLKADLGETNTPWSGSSPRKWANSITNDLGDALGLPDEYLSRDRLFALWSSPRSIEAAFLATMAWGGMKRGHGRLIWKHRTVWAPICEKMASGDLKPTDAYAAFLLKRMEDQLPGMGPAYFTKLIFFATCAHRKTVGNAFILDQWTARSVHCLTNQFEWPRVSVDYATKNRFKQSKNPSAVRVTVSDRVSASDYQKYCHFVDELARTLAVEPPYLLEEKMFGAGGRSPSGWRLFLMQNGGRYLNC